MSWHARNNYEDFQASCEMLISEGSEKTSAWQHCDREWICEIITVSETISYKSEISNKMAIIIMKKGLQLAKNNKFDQPFGGTKPQNAISFLSKLCYSDELNKYHAYLALSRKLNFDDYYIDWRCRRPCSWANVNNYLHAVRAGQRDRCCFSWYQT